MVLLPEEAEMTLAELRQVAARQQNQIEMQQQLLIVKEQRLKFLKQQEARHHLTEQNIETTYLQNLKEKVEAQELKLRQLRALHGQVDQQKTNNCNLGAELESVRALFSEKEKELSVAVGKVEELTRQLNEIRKNNTRKPMVAPMAVNEIENLRRELMYRTKLTEQQNHHISQQRDVISERQHNICQMDDKIAELTQRLRRKRLMNQQLANQIHNAALARHSNPPHANTHSSINIATVEPVQRELQESEQTRDDLAAKLHVVHRNDLYEFSLKKNDPKYQTLPYNTKFYLKGKTNQDDALQLDDEFPDADADPYSGNTQEPKVNSPIDAPHPFGNSTTTNVKPPIAKAPVPPPLEKNKVNVTANKPPTPVQVVSALPETFNNAANSNDRLKGDSVDSSGLVAINKQKFMGKMQSPADYKKTKEKFNGAVVKPVVPPKPTFPVKPVPPPRQTPTKESPQSEDKGDVVSKAISVLQNRSSEKEKNAISNYKERLLYYRYVSRYNVRKSSTDGSPVEPKVTTYFPISSGTTKSSTTFQDNMKKKPTSGQLPIKPKPLTIRKTPGLEPPKLKIQQNLSQSSIYRKAQDANVMASTFKPIVPPPSVEPLQVNDPFAPHVQEITANCKLETCEISPENVPKQMVTEPKLVPSVTIEEIKALDFEVSEHSKNGERQNNNFHIAEPEDSDGGSSSPCDSLECVPIHGSSERSRNESENGMQDVVFNTYHRVKGNLKTEASVRSPRRVSFDPLALLLDAALEGELELVKKTTLEVPNPSAANDEGITALHNSICAGHVEVVTFLVEFGCDVNAQDSDGWTPLHCAASCNNLPMVEFLVERGACIFATTLSDHETAAEKCEEEEEGFDGCSQYLYGLQRNLGMVNNGVVYAVYDYEGQNSDELSFKDGNSITVLRNGDEQEKEWWWARVNDEEGYIPRNLLGLYPRITIKKE